MSPSSVLSSIFQSFWWFHFCPLVRSSWSSCCSQQANCWSVLCTFKNISKLRSSNLHYSTCHPFEVLHGTLPVQTVQSLSWKLAPHLLLSGPWPAPSKPSKVRAEDLETAASVGKYSRAWFLKVFVGVSWFLKTQIKGEKWRKQWQFSDIWCIESVYKFVFNDSLCMFRS